MAQRGRKRGSVMHEHGDEETQGPQMWSTTIWWPLIWIPPLTLLCFGIFHIAYIQNSSQNSLYGNIAWALTGFPSPFQQPTRHDLDKLTSNVVPVHCHSHNDYWRKVPLYEALHLGCTSVEADIYLVDEDLQVGHNPGDLAKDRTLRSMYLDPLVQMLDHKNAIYVSNGTTSSSSRRGIFDMDVYETLVLLIDFKTDGYATFPVVLEQLETLRQRGYLTHYDGNTTISGPITIVGTGNTPFDAVITADHRDIFFDAPLDHLHKEKPGDTYASLDEAKQVTPTKLSKGDSVGQGTVGIRPDSHFDLTNSYYASANFAKTIGWLWFGRITQKQRKLIRGQIHSAKSRGLKARYWGAPGWPVGLRNKVWNVLIEEGADYLNGDDLEAMTKVDRSVITSN